VDEKEKAGNHLLIPARMISLIFKVLSVIFDFLRIGIKVFDLT